MPFWIPASRMVIPSVTMNPFSRPLTIRKPLTSPTAAPVANRMMSPAGAPSIAPSPNDATGTISQAASIGARP
jgi:hypothetical protein